MCLILRVSFCGGSGRRRRRRRKRRSRQLPQWSPGEEITRAPPLNSATRDLQRARGRRIVSLATLPSFHWYTIESSLFVLGCYWRPWPYAWTEHWNPLTSASANGSGHNCRRVREYSGGHTCYSSRETLSLDRSTKGAKPHILSTKGAKPHILSTKGAKPHIPLSNKRPWMQAQFSPHTTQCQTSLPEQPDSLRKLQYDSHPEAQPVACAFTCRSLVQSVWFLRGLRM